MCRVFTEDTLATCSSGYVPTDVVPARKRLGPTSYPPDGLGRLWAPS